LEGAAKMALNTCFSFCSISFYFSSKSAACRYNFSFKSSSKFFKTS